MKTIRWVLPMLLGAGLTARAYVLNYNSFTNVQHWNFLAPNSAVPTNVLNRATHALRYYLASDGYSTTNTAAELNGVRAALGQWQAIPNTLIKFEEAGLVNPPVDVNTSDNTNIIYWTKTTTIVNGRTDISGALGVTFTSSTTTNNELLQADIVFNGDEYQWFTDFFDPNNPGIFVESVALHESGHFLGVNHSPLGGATMFFAGNSGVNVQDGASSDDIAALRYLYGTNLANFGAIKGSVTVNGTPVAGAIVVAQDAASSNDFTGTLTWTNGNFAMNAIPPGTYRLRAAPLDPAATRSIDSLCTGPDISSVYNNAFTSFLPTTNLSVTVLANSTNTVNFTVVSNAQPFRIANIRLPTANAGSYSWGPMPAAMVVGQSNYTIGVASSNLPTSGAAFTITGDGLTLGAPTFNANLGGLGLNFISMGISIASNATPGLRTFIVQQGTNFAYAGGYLKIRPAVLDYNFDGLDDAFQRTYFPLFTAANAAPTADPDGDGMNNLAEYIAGTNPTNAASVFKLLSPTNSSGGTAVRWLSVAGKSYQVLSRTNLLAGSWRTNGTAVTATGTNTQYLDAGGTNGVRFYRVQVLQ
jgi:Matrixin/Carboxypeptidase regulatory-like domain